MKALRKERYRAWKQQGGKFEGTEDYRSSWLFGFVHRIQQRYDMLRREHYREYGERFDLVIRRSDAEIEDFLKKAETKKLPVAKQSRKNMSAMLKGARAADKVDITGRAMNGGSEAAAKRIADAPRQLGRGTHTTD